MTSALLDDEELLRLALSAMNADRDAEAMDLLKRLLERQPDHGQANYLLAALHAELGMMDRAEAGFRAAVNALPDMPLARFQLGQLLLLQGDDAQAAQVLAPLTGRGPGDALGAYARALSATAAGDAAAAIVQLEDGLGHEQPIPALAGDMQRLLGHLRNGASAAPPGPSLFLSGYGRGH